MKKLLLIPFIFITISLHAQYLSQTGTRQAAMGNTGVAGYDLWAAFHNQAGQAQIENISGGVYFSNYFGIKELSTKALTFALPVLKTGVFGMNYNYYGFDLFNQSKVGLSYSMKLGKMISAGIQLDYLRTKQGLEYGIANTFTAELGMIASPVKNLQIGAHVFNPTGSKISDFSNEVLPTIFTLGIGYTFSEKVIFNIETEKDLEFEPVFKSGLEYIAFKSLFLRLGITTKPTQYTFGIGYEFHNLNFDISFINHQTLGFTSQFGLSYKLVKAENSARYSE